MLRRALLLAAGSDRVRELVRRAPVSRAVVSRFVAGESVADAVRTARELTGAGLRVSLDHLGEDTRASGQAEATAKAYAELLHRLADEGLAAGADVSVKLSALGQALDRRLAAEQARSVAEAAAGVGATVTVDMEDHTTTDATLAAVQELRRDHPGTGAVIQAYLRRSEADCRTLAGAGSRVRLCKGAYREPGSVAFRSAAEVNRSYRRCLSVLMAGDGYPMVATHDPRLLAAAAEIAGHHGRGPDRFEFQMLYGVRPDEQRRLAAAGSTVRVYVPYGDQWYGYLMRRLAERPANVAFFLRALATRG